MTKEFKVFVQEYSLTDFCKRTEELINNGYMFEFETNEGCPTRYGNIHTCVMLLKSVVEAVEEPKPKPKPKPKAEAQVSLDAAVVVAEPVSESQVEVTITDADGAPKVDAPFMRSRKKAQTGASTEA